MAVVSEVHRPNPACLCNIDNDAEPFLCITENLLGLDPGLLRAGADAGVGRFELSTNSSAWKIGFQRIQLEEIGLHRQTRKRAPAWYLNGLGTVMDVLVLRSLRGGWL